MNKSLLSKLEYRPASPVCDKLVEVSVVARRCVYVNNLRIAGAKPYVSENLPSHEFTAKLGDVLDAFTEADIRAVLAEKKALRKYFAAQRASLMER